MDQLKTKIILNDIIYYVQNNDIDIILNLLNKDNIPFILMGFFYKENNQISLNEEECFQLLSEISSTKIVTQIFKTLQNINIDNSIDDELSDDSIDDELSDEYIEQKKDIKQKKEKYIEETINKNINNDIVIDKLKIAKQEQNKQVKNASIRYLRMFECSNGIQMPCQLQDSYNLENGINRHLKKDKTSILINDYFNIDHIVNISDAQQMVNEMQDYFYSVRELKQKLYNDIRDAETIADVLSIRFKI